LHKSPKEKSFLPKQECESGWPLMLIMRHMWVRRQRKDTGLGEAKYSIP